jgi:hypothetical protein
MSAKDTEWAYGVAGLTAPQKAVLLALAFCRNGVTGDCFPGQKELAKMTSLSLATVKRALGDLADPEIVGAITRTKTAKGRYRSNDRYALNYEYETQLSVSPAHSEPGSDSEEVGLTQSTSGAHSERAVELTGIEPEVNRKRAPQLGTRIADDFAVTPVMVAWAREHAPLVDGPRATQMFINHWIAASGRNATKRDWIRTWQNWLLRDQQAEERRPKPRQTPDERARSTLALAIDEFTDQRGIAS